MKFNLRALHSVAFILKETVLAFNLIQLALLEIKIETALWLWNKHYLSK
jgi:hypothetical protein